MAKTRTVLLRRCTYEKHDGTVVLLHYAFSVVRSRRNTVAVIHKDRVPEFEGYEAWFEIERVHAKPWPYWRAIRQLHDIPIPKRGPFS